MISSVYQSFQSERILMQMINRNRSDDNTTQDQCKLISKYARFPLQNAVHHSLVVFARCPYLLRSSRHQPPCTNLRSSLLFAPSPRTSRPELTCAPPSSWPPPLASTCPPSPNCPPLP